MGCIVQGRIVQGTYRTGDMPSCGHIVQWTQYPCNNVRRHIGLERIDIAPMGAMSILSGLAGWCNEFSSVGRETEGMGRGGGGAYMGC
jgi:hypothetical protein